MPAYLYPNIRGLALDLLARREHSYFELQQKLKAREFAEEEIQVVLDALAKEGLQSDARFTECYVRSRAARGFGPLRIQLELQSRGISEDLMQSNVSEKAHHWLELAKKTRLKKFGAQKPKDFASRAKQMQFLQYKGFTNEQIKFALESVGASSIDDFD